MAGRRARRGSGRTTPIAAGLPGPSSYTETWTGTNGATWPATWTLGTEGGTATIQSNRGSITTGTGAYASGKTARWSGIPAHGDAELTGTIYFADNVEQYAQVALRADFVTGPYGNKGYYLEFGPSGTTWGIGRYNGGSTPTSIATVAYTYGAGVGINFRLRAVAGALNARVWAVGASEPGTWGHTSTNTDPQLNPGYVQMTTSTGGTGAAKTIQFDDFTLASLDGISFTKPFTTPAAMGWTLAFEDDFPGTTLDTSKWVPNRGDGVSNSGAFNPDVEGAYFAPSAVSVASSLLKLTLTSAPLTVGGVAYAWKSGTVMTQGKFYMGTNSYAEASMTIPATGTGLWPAFWAVTDAGWPPEIDGFEFFDTSANTRPQFNYHYNDGVANRQKGPYAFGATGVNYTSGSHVYGILRRGGWMIPYVDGVPYPPAGWVNVSDTAPYFIILNLSCYASGAPTMGSHMDVDWVRIWNQ